MVALWGGLGAPTHSPGTTDRRCSLPSPFYSPKIQAERAPAIPAADDVSTWVPARFACFRRYLDDFDFQLVPPLFFRALPLPPSPSSSNALSTAFRLTLLQRRESGVVDGRFRAIRQTPRRATREIEKRGREREREYLLGGRRGRSGGSGEEERGARGESDCVAKRGVDWSRELCRSGWTTRRDPSVSSGRSIVYPGVDRWPIYTCTVAPPRAQEDRHKWSSTRHSEAFHAAGVLATRYASTPTPSTPSRISSGRKNLSSVRWRQGVVRRDVT